MQFLSLFLLRVLLNTNTACILDLKFNSFIQWTIRHTEVIQKNPLYSDTILSVKLINGQGNSYLLDILVVRGTQQQYFQPMYHVEAYRLLPPFAFTDSPQTLTAIERIAEH